MRRSAGARVFISCGQSKETDEIEIASQIERRLRQLGFDPYIAVAEQSLRGLTENIFERLRTSEYLIFIDFKREALANTTPPVHRGSLFSHQELAIASFLSLDVLAFQEDGVKRDDGIIRFLQANAIPFSDRRHLASVVSDNIQTRSWNPSWRNELILERDKSEYTEAQILNLAGSSGRFFHINVRNRHRDKFATNCYVYLEKAVKLGSAQEISLKTVEFKWAGTGLPNVGITPGSTRAFDAFFIFRNSPTIIQFNALTDASDFHPNIQGEGEYELSYLVTSDNFPPARGTFKLTLNRLLDHTTFDLQGAASEIATAN